MRPPNHALPPPPPPRYVYDAPEAEEVLSGESDRVLDLLVRVDENLLGHVARALRVGGEERVRGVEWGQG
jgi:hypothetical protein